LIEIERAVIELLFEKKKCMDLKGDLMAGAFKEIDENN
jgi:hypothetical protein